MVTCLLTRRLGLTVKATKRPIDLASHAVKAVNFPNAWSPAERATLIGLLSDEPEGEPPKYAEQAFEEDIGSWAQYLRVALDDYLTRPVAPVVVSWLRALARESGQLSR